MEEYAIQPNASPLATGLSLLAVLPALLVSLSEGWLTGAIISLLVTFPILLYRLGHTWQLVWNRKNDRLYCRGPFGEAEILGCRITWLNARIEYWCQHPAYLPVWRDQVSLETWKALGRLSRANSGGSKH